ncbi:hypothetical protein MMC13_001040 [Lambiella insularis]|nr:hypothetical protein [Lambiella insularis]
MATFMSLPLEIRVMIYDLLLVTSCPQPGLGYVTNRYGKPTDWRPESSSPERPAKSILEVCKAINTEATKVLYGRNCFIIAKSPSVTHKGVGYGELWNLALLCCDLESMERKVNWLFTHVTDEIAPTWLLEISWPKFLRGIGPYNCSLLQRLELWENKMTSCALTFAFLPNMEDHISGQSWEEENRTDKAYYELLHQISDRLLSKMPQLDTCKFPGAGQDLELMDQFTIVFTRTDIAGDLSVWGVHHKDAETIKREEDWKKRYS